MPATIENVIRTRNSAKRRMSTLRKMRTRRSYHNETSPLMSCGEVFENNVRNIEREYDSMLQRIENATVNL
jgi:hypothetical protein